MKSAIVYYSFTGNTQKVAAVMSEYLKDQGEVRTIVLRDLKESGKFFQQAAQAIRHKRAEIDSLPLDLKDYDLICLGTPVWAFAPSPAMNTFLDKCFGIEGKEIILFTTYGSGTGNQRCLNYMQALLAQKGARASRQFSIQQFRVSDREFVLSKIKEAMRLWPNG